MNATVQIVSAVRLYTLPAYGLESVPVTPETDSAVQESRLHAIEEQMRRVLSPRPSWPVVVRVGEPATEIADLAGTTNARVILTGRGRHGAIDRVLGGETVLRLLQVGNTPVLATAPTLTSPPRRVVIATDFSEFSLYAAEVALSMIAPDATVYLVNVRPYLETTYSVLRERSETFQDDAKRGFAEMRTRLDAPRVHYEEQLLEGNPAQQLQEFCEKVNADLVVSATHGYGFFRRMILGSVAASLVREAPCSVLCVPGSARTVAVARARAAGTLVTTTLEAGHLDAQLAAFGKRNEGRYCNIEVDQDDLGSQMLARAVRLVGAAFDVHGRNVSLMFGASGIVGQHLTHGITNVTTVELTTDGAGRDQVLRISTPAGYTLVMLLTGQGDG